MIRLKGSLAAILLSTLIIAPGLFVVPVIAQGGVTAGFTVQVNFYYLCVCSLQNVRVVVSDQTGRVVATSESPDGSMLIITFRVNTPEYWLLLNAMGYASFSYNRPWPVRGSVIIGVQNFAAPMYYYYATILLRGATPTSAVFGS